MAIEWCGIIAFIQATDPAATEFVVNDMNFGDASEFRRH
jgi:hypothetical protein